jgi:hypothetical protein
MQVIKDAADKCLMRYRGPKEAAEQVKLLLSSATLHDSEADANVTVEVVGKKRAAETDGYAPATEDKLKRSLYKNGKGVNGVVLQQNGKTHKKGHIGHIIPSGAL